MIESLIASQFDDINGLADQKRKLKSLQDSVAQLERKIFDRNEELAILTEGKPVLFKGISVSFESKKS